MSRSSKRDILLLSPLFRLVKIITLLTGSRWLNALELCGHSVRASSYTPCKDIRVKLADDVARWVIVDHHDRSPVFRLSAANPYLCGIFPHHLCEVAGLELCGLHTKIEIFPLSIPLVTQFFRLIDCPIGRPLHGNVLPYAHAPKLVVMVR